MDYSTLLYDPTYAILGVTARLAFSTGFGKDVTVIDKTTGIEVLDSVGVTTVRPGAVIKISEMVEKNIAVSDLNGASLELNGRTWQVKAAMPRPAPEGASVGEYLLVLMEANDGR